MTLPAPLWQPSADRIDKAGITRLQRWLAAERGLHFDSYEALWQWSVDDLEGFWGAIWDFCGVKSHSPYSRVLAEREMPHAKWFPGATLNYAEHMLAFARRPDAGTRLALVFQSELCPRTEITWAQLAATTGALTATLTRLGVAQGDRVVGYLPNIPEALASLLAVASMGAIWSSSSLVSSVSPRSDSTTRPRRTLGWTSSSSLTSCAVSAARSASRGFSSAAMAWQASCRRRSRLACRSASRNCARNSPVLGLVASMRVPSDMPIGRCSDMPKGERPAGPAPAR